MTTEIPIEDGETILEWHAMKVGNLLLSDGTSVPVGPGDKIVGRLDNGSLWPRAVIKATMQ